MEQNILGKIIEWYQLWIANLWASFYLRSLSAVILESLCEVFYNLHPKASVAQFCCGILWMIYLNPSIRVLMLSFLSLLSTFFRTEKCQGGWVAQSIKYPTSAQVMISQFVSLSPTLSSVLTVRSLPKVLSLPLSLTLRCSLAHSLSLQINK